MPDLLMILGGVAAGVVCMAVVFRYWGYLGREGIFLVLPMNALADGLVMFTEDSAVHSGQLRALMLLIIIAAALPNIRFDVLNTLVFALLGYLLPLALLSSNIGLSLNVYSKFAFALMMLPLARTCINTREDLHRLHRSIVIGVAIFVATFLVFQLFQLGIQIYRTGVFTAGGAKFTKFLAYSLIIAPLMAATAKGRLGRLRAGLFVVAAVVVLLVFHRSAMVALALGYLILFLYGFTRSRIAIYGSAAVVAGVVFVFAFAPNYLGTLVDLAERRASYAAVEVEMESEGGRVAETTFVATTIGEAGVVELLFGKELFNGGELQGHRVQGGGYRPLHVDYSIILLGSGFIGFLLYASVYLKTALMVMHGTRSIRSTRVGRGIRATFLALLVAATVIAASNQIWALSPLSLLFMYMGTLLVMARLYTPQPQAAQPHRQPLAPAQPIHLAAAHP